MDLILRTLLCNCLDTAFSLLDCNQIGSIEQSFSDELAPDTRAVFIRSSSDPALCLNNEPDIQNTSFDIELISPSLDYCQQMAEAVKATLNGYSGTITGTRILNIDVTDHSDLYIRQSSSNQADHIAALSIEIIH